MYIEACNHGSEQRANRYRDITVNKKKEIKLKNKKQFLFSRSSRAEKMRSVTSMYIQIYNILY